MLSRIAAAGALALAGCGGGGGSSTPAPKAYQGQWAYVSGGMVSGPDLMNLRSDGTYSDVIYYSGTIGDLSGGVYASKGTYTFAPATPGDDTQGALTLHRTHRWAAGAWVDDTGDETGTYVITAGSPRTAVFDDTYHYEYYGAEAAIPSSFPKNYEGQWRYLTGGMVSGPDLLNLRSDGTYSDVTYSFGKLGDPTAVIGAEKGTYTFTPSVPGEDFLGTVAVHRTHVWNIDTWIPAADDRSDDCAVTLGSPRTMTLGMLDYEYYGPEVSIPTSF